MLRIRSLIIGIIIVVVALWVVTPIARAMILLAEAQHPIGAPPVIAGVRATDAHFYTSDDGVGISGSSNTDNPIPISGWLCVVKPSAPTVILVPGWKADRTTMISYARFLLRGDLNVLMIDLRGTGHSGGEFSLGLNEPMDIKAAVSYLDGLTQVTTHHYGELGVSFGAGVAIAAAGGNGADYPGAPQIAAVVADSPWATEDEAVDRLNDIPVFGQAIPLPHSITLFGHQLNFLPGAQWAVDSTLGGVPDTRSALAGAQNLAAGQALLIIHSAHDDNATTSATVATELFNAAKVRHKFLWTAPMGGNIGALSAQPSVYEAKVLGFFQKYLVPVKDPTVPSVAPFPGESPGRHYPLPYPGPGAHN